MNHMDLKNTCAGQVADLRDTEHVVHLEKVFDRLRWAFGVLIYEMLAGYPPFYDDDAIGTYQKILSGEVQFPPHFSRSAKNLVRKLLTADLTKRIGCLESGVNEIKNHAWFANVKWESLLLKKELPPIKPKVSGADDTSNFEDYSKLDPIRHEFVLTADDQALFKDLC